MLVQALTSFPAFTAGKVSGSIPLIYAKRVLKSSDFGIIFFVCLTIAFPDYFSGTLFQNKTPAFFQNCIHSLSRRLSLFVHSFLTGWRGSCLNGSSLLSCLRERNQSVIHIDRQKGQLFSGSQVIRLARLPRFERPCAPIFDKKDPICYIIPRSVHRSDNQTNTL